MAGQCGTNNEKIRDGGHRRNPNARGEMGTNSMGRQSIMAFQSENRANKDTVHPPVFSIRIICLDYG
jgi:hypothetical protein